MKTISLSVSHVPDTQGGVDIRHRAKVLPKGQLLPSKSKNEVLHHTI